MNVFLQGLVAGFAIAVPVGPIAVLILDRGVRRGFKDASLAGLGAASADLVYAALAATAGAVIAAFVDPALTPLRAIAVALLVLIALRNLRAAFRRVDDADLPHVSGGRTYLTFLALTLLNPVTVVYFASLIVGLDLTDASIAEKSAFVAAAFLASASWQLFLAASASVAGARLSTRVRAATSVLGSAVILTLALKMALDI